MVKKIICKCCNKHLGNFEENTFSFMEMKLVSAIEFSNTTKNIKCHSCHNWNSFDENQNQTINYKRKAQEHLYFKKSN